MNSWNLSTTYYERIGLTIIIIDQFTVVGGFSALNFTDLKD